MYKKSQKLISFIRSLFKSEGDISLHEPIFDYKDKKILNEVIDSTFVSSVGPTVNEFESSICDFTKSKYAVACVNGTSAIHIPLILSGVLEEDEVITQSLTFVASCNAIHYCKASPIFLDVTKKDMGLSPESLKDFIDHYCEMRNDGNCWNKTTNKIIRACIATHTYGLACSILEIKKICKEFNIKLIEDAAESLGTFISNTHSGLVGDFGILSFNGNKIITSGGGGMILIKNKKDAERAKHLTTTARVSNELFFDHDMVGYNFRLPNLNAALGLSQFSKLEEYINIKREVAEEYHEWGYKNGFNFVKEAQNTKSNYWLNTILCDDIEERDKILKDTNQNRIFSRPCWIPLHKLAFNKGFQKSNLHNTDFLFERIVNLPSGVIKERLK